MNQPTDTVARNLKDLREQRGLSLDQLAALTGVSKSMLRQIETGKSSPTIATIWKIANGLRISFTSLLREPEIEAEVRTFTGTRPLTASSDRYRVFPLVKFEPHQSFETYYLEIDPGASFTGEPHQGNIYEYIFVIQGRMELAVESRTFTISENEFLKFDANHRHEYRAVSDDKVRAIMQLSYLQ